MKLNLSDYFPVTQDELKEFDSFLDSGDQGCNLDDGFERLMAAKDSFDKVEAFRKGRFKPTSIKLLTECLSNAYGKNIFRLSDEFGINNIKWKDILQNKISPAILSARNYATMALKFNIPFKAIKEAILGTFRLYKAGISGIGNVYARSDRQKSKTSDINAAVEELLQKGSKTIHDKESQEIDVLLKEIESWMK